MGVLGALFQRPGPTLTTRALTDFSLSVMEPCHHTSNQNAEYLKCFFLWSAKSDSYDNLCKGQSRQLTEGPLPSNLIEAAYTALKK